MAQQVSQDALAFVRHMKGVRIAAIMGGMPFGKQIQSAQLAAAEAAANVRHEKTVVDIYPQDKNSTPL